MTERLVDVIDPLESVLHTYAITIEPPFKPEHDADYEEKALAEANHDLLVADAEQDGLTARMHVSRGGCLQPFGHALAANQKRVSFQQKVREGAYSLWQGSGCPDDMAAIHWHAAHEQQLRERAYDLWERAGRPADQANSIWHRASELSPCLDDNFIADSPPRPAAETCASDRQTGNGEHSSQSQSKSEGPAAKGSGATETAEDRKGTAENSKSILQNGDEIATSQTAETTSPMSAAVGLSGEDAVPFAEQCKRNTEALENLGRVLTRAFQGAGHQLMSIGKKQWERNLEGMNKLAGAKSLREFAAKQRDLVGDGLQNMVKDSHFVAETLLRSIDQAGKVLGSR